MTSYPPLSRAIRKGRAALLVIDMQNETCGPRNETLRPELYASVTARVIPTSRGCLTTFAARTSK